MPRGLLLHAEAVENHDHGTAWMLDELIGVARLFGVSVEAVLRRLVTLGRAPVEEYQAFRASASAPAPPKAAGGDFYVTKSRDLGRGYVRVVVSAQRRGLLDAYETATYLGVRVGQVDRLARASRV